MFGKRGVIATQVAYMRRCSFHWLCKYWVEFFWCNLKFKKAVVQLLGHMTLYLFFFIRFRTVLEMWEEENIETIETR